MWALYPCPYCAHFLVKSDLFLKLSIEKLLLVSNFMNIDICQRIIGFLFDSHSWNDLSIIISFLINGCWKLRRELSILIVIIFLVVFWLEVNSLSRRHFLWFLVKTDKLISIANDVCEEWMDLHQMCTSVSILVLHLGNRMDSIYVPWFTNDVLNLCFQLDHFQFVKNAAILTHMCHSLTYLITRWRVPIA